MTTYLSTPLASHSLTPAPVQITALRANVFNYSVVNPGSQIQNGVNRLTVVITLDPDVSELEDEVDAAIIAGRRDEPVQSLESMLAETRNE